MLDTFWIILTGILVASCCGLLGCFLLLRKMTMIGDAISHAVLPGIVIAYLTTHSRTSMTMLLGAAVFGVLVTVLIEGLQKKARMQKDAAIGVSFTFLFALGIILISLFAGKIDLDQDCVLYGEIAYVPLDTWTFGQMNMGPRTVWILGFLLICIVGFIYKAYKGLVLTTFDEVYAASLGVSVNFWHYALMSLVSLSTVLSFDAVGAILVVAFLVGPAATAYLLTHQLKKMLFLSLLAGILAAVSGYLLAVWVDGSIAGAMAVVIGLEFLLAFVYVLLQKFIQAKFKIGSDYPNEMGFQVNV